MGVGAVRATRFPRRRGDHLQLDGGDRDEPDHAKHLCADIPVFRRRRWILHRRCGLCRAPLRCEREDRVARHQGPAQRRSRQGDRSPCARRQPQLRIPSGGHRKGRRVQVKVARPRSRGGFPVILRKPGTNGQNVRWSSGTNGQNVYWRNRNNGQNVRWRSETNGQNVRWSSGTNGQNVYWRNRNNGQNVRWRK